MFMELLQRQIVRLLIAVYTRLSCTKQGKFEHCKYNRDTWGTKARPQNMKHFAIYCHVEHLHFHFEVLFTK